MNGMTEDEGSGDLMGAVDVGLAGGPDARYLLVPVGMDVFESMLEALTMSGILQRRAVNILRQVTLTREPDFTASEEAFDEVRACAMNAESALDELYEKVRELMGRHEESPLFGIRMLVPREDADAGEG